MSELNIQDSEAVYQSVQNYYGKVLNTTKDLKTSACCTSSRPHPIIMDSLKSVPCEIKNKYYGCGTPIPFGIEGLNVLDLGSGSGRDCYIASKLVGPKGFVTGIDMTDEQLDVAKKHIESFTEKLGYKEPNLRFVKGFIECLDEAGIEEGSQDLVISNCVVNLSPDKKRVLEQVYKSLRSGGEFYFSDVYCSRRLPEKARKHEVLFGECISGALYVEDFKRLCREVGFEDPRILSQTTVDVSDPELQEVIGEAQFYSITFRLFKLDNLESICEDYGQFAVYKGTIPGHPHSYTLDNHHHLEKGKPFMVCGNTAAMLGESWLAPHFEVHGDRSVHYGPFDCSNASGAPAAAAAASSSSCGGGSCGTSSGGGGGCC